MRPLSKLHIKSCFGFPTFGKSTLQRNLSQRPFCDKACLPCIVQSSHSLRADCCQLYVMLCIGSANCHLKFFGDAVTTSKQSHQRKCWAGHRYHHILWLKQQHQRGAWFEIWRDTTRGERLIRCFHLAAKQWFAFPLWWLKMCLVQFFSQLSEQVCSTHVF